MVSYSITVDGFIYTYMPWNNDFGEKEVIVNNNIKTYGDINFRGQCAKEDLVVQTIVNQVRKRYPHVMFTHIKNEGKRTKAQIDFDKSMGMVGGISDLVFFGHPMMLMEVKRQDHTKSKWQPNQQEFLINTAKQGCFSCVCFGWEAGMQAVEEWLSLQNNS